MIRPAGSECRSASFAGARAARPEPPPRHPEMSDGTQSVAGLLAYARLRPETGARPLFPGTVAFDDIPASVEHIRGGKLRRACSSHRDA
jgi:hypothetical protein